MTVQTSRLAVGAKPRSRTASRQAQKRRWIGLLYLSPALLLYGVIVLVPLLQTVNYSFYRWDVSWWPSSGSASTRPMDP